MNLKDNSYEKRYEAYRKEGEKLIQETLKERDLIDQRYKNKPVPGGLDGMPGNLEYKALTQKFGQKVKELRKKYGIDESEL